MESLAKLKKKRALIRTAITKLIAKFETLINDKSKEVDLYSEILEQLNDREDSLKSLNKEIEASITVEQDFENEINNSEEYNENIVKCKFQLKKQIKSLKESKVPIESQSTSTLTDGALNLKLPEIPLPKFSGKPEEWNTFKLQFNNLITSNEQLSEAQKLHYLTASLINDARAMITIEDNFSSLFQALKDRYENDRIIVEIHINAILDANKIMQPSGKDLRNLVDIVRKSIRALKVLDYNRNNFSDALILNILLQKLDKDTRKNYEMTISSNEVPKLDDLILFLEKRSQVLETINKSTSTKPLSKDQKNPCHSKSFTSLTESPQHCLLCKADHIIMKCPQFLNMTAKKRCNFVKTKRLCYNCLSAIHNINQCKSTSTCKKCSKRHHSLIHIDRGEEGVDTNQAVPISNRGNLSSNLSPTANAFLPHNYPNSQMSVTTLGENTQTLGNTHSTINNTVMNTTSSFNKQVLLSTAIIYVQNARREFVPLRALLDSGSQNNFITKECTELLCLKRKKINASVSGLNGSVMNIRETVIATIANENRTFNETLEFFVVPKITRITPVTYLNIISVTQLQAFQLADPEFDKPGPIHVLLSNEVFFQLLGTHKINMQNLIFQETVFGYIASGSKSMPQQGNFTNYCGLVQSTDDLSSTMKKFWEIETVHDINPIKSKEEKYCEEHFQRTHTRREDGRYVVEMPFKTGGLSCLGESRGNANKRLNQLLKRFTYNPVMKILYEDFINEYSYLGHSEEISWENNPKFSYYLPHHGVYRPEKPSTKLRVVFDASAPTTSGVSLNDVLLNGGLVQDELFDIICRFRTYKFAFTADIIKMYRQILIAENQRDLLRILWKCSEEQPVKTFRLKTVTYGTSNAPYLATRTLNQLAIDEKDKFPLASRAVLQDFYVDDVLTGANNLKEAQELQTQLIELLERGGMTLHRWCANHSELLKIATSNKEYSFHNHDDDKSTKTLGLLWNPTYDFFLFNSSVKDQIVSTKRTVLSDIARIYDPLGLLGPGITKAKIFIQKLWLSKLGWNDPLPDDVKEEWRCFIRTLQHLNDLKINRYVLQDENSEIELHGFADASELAYGAVIYLRCPTRFKTSLNLLCSKSRVAPLKSLTIPRLELCAAVLLSQLTFKIVNLLKLHISKIILWCDSTIVLAWIQISPHLLKTFVANRVCKIQELTQNYQWRHIRSEDNPADFVSRGLTFDKLIDCDLWWYGPSFLREGDSTSNTNIDLQHVKNTTEFSSELKQKTDTTLICSNSNEFINDILSISNNYTKILRVLSYIFRFLDNTRNPTDKRKGHVSIDELSRAETFLVREVQKGEFKAEYTALLEGKQISKKSKLRLLNPFLDADKVLRVGGRLDHADLEFSQKHQYILPAKGKLCSLIADYYHKKYLHIGSQSLLCHLRQKFWPLQGRNLTRKITHECVICSKSNPITIQQLMGSLPSERVTPSAPFNYVGADFGGPFFIKYKGQRKGILNKIYLAIFVCFVTKAVHLELVSELTTDAFIATLKRFIARRGKCAVIFSDNAKNFVGANAELQRLHNLLRRPTEKLANYLSQENIIWKFIPPCAPNFGGLWEAGIKSVKYHLKRTVGNARLTFEELLTVVAQVESILNSRPITPLSSDVNDLEALTPGHFLIGRPMTAIVEPELINVNESRLSRWHRITKWVQLIWDRWHREYLNTLQQRSKWQFAKNNVAIGTLVLIKEDNLPANKYVLGRIANVFPGADGNVRVVEIKTSRGLVKRGISKIALLPQQNSEN